MKNKKIYIKEGDIVRVKCWECKKIHTGVVFIKQKTKIYVDRQGYEDIGFFDEMPSGEFYIKDVVEVIGKVKLKKVLTQEEEAFEELKNSGSIFR